MDNIPNLKYKTTLCLSWAQGLACEKAEGCYFAHGEDDLRTIEQNRIAVASRNKAHWEVRPAENYKTIFCRFYGKGECKLGDDCTFAHERREKKIRKANSLSAPIEQHYAYPADPQQQYALYAYYAQLNPWIHHYSQSPSPDLAFLPTQHLPIHEERASEEMKMSSETVCSDREGLLESQGVKSSQEGAQVEMGEAGEMHGEGTKERSLDLDLAS